jgi:hypothetical protein
MVRNNKIDFMWFKNPKHNTLEQCSDKYFMESLISSTAKAASSLGTPRQSLSSSEHTMSNQGKLPIPKTSSENSLVGFMTGEASSPSVPERPLPTAEEIQASKSQNPRILTMTSEEFYQWRQVLGNYKTLVKSQLKTH